MKETLRTKLGDNALAEALINMVDAGVNYNGVNNTVPTYAVDLDYFETIDRNVVAYLTTYEVNTFFEGVMGLAAKHINALWNKEITHPEDLANFDLDDFEAVRWSVKGKVTLPGLAQIRLKQACGYFQFVLDTGRNMKNQFLLLKILESHAIQFKVVKD